MVGRGVHIDTASACKHTIRFRGFDMWPWVAVAVALGAMFLAPSVAAQDDQQVSFAIYYRCFQGQETRADEIIRDVFGPILDRHVSAGSLASWGLSAHVMGSDWRRLMFWIGNDRDVMFDVREQFIEEIQRDHADEWAELGTICPSHDDYIWNIVRQNTGDGAGGGATLATYYMCDLAQQERVDSLVTQVWAPVYDRHVSEGTIDSWAWLAHRHGGKWRRLGVMGAADAKSLLNAQETIGDDLNEQNPLAGRLFGEICTTHDDYIWNAVVPQPEGGN